MVLSMYNEILIIVSFIVQGVILGNHLVHYKYAKINNTKYPIILYITNIIVFFITVFVMRHAFKGIENDSNVHLIAIPLAIACSFIAYKYLFKFNKKHNKSFNYAHKKHGPDAAQKTRRAR